MSDWLTNHNVKTQSVMQYADSVRVPRQKAFNFIVEYINEMKANFETEQFGTILAGYQEPTGMQYYIKSVPNGSGVSDFLVSSNVYEDLKLFL